MEITVYCANFVSCADRDECKDHEIILGGYSDFGGIGGRCVYDDFVASLQRDEVCNFLDFSRTSLLAVRSLVEELFGDVE